jgi:NAD(P)-dependent dehydrogenase (short-subunit alcohol dehydrogenase family)
LDYVLWGDLRARPSHPAAAGAHVLRVAVREDMTQALSGKKVAVITGGASGIGRAFAEELAARGTEVVVADRQIELAREVAAGICARGGSAHSLEVDVRRFDSVKNLVDTTVWRSGKIDYFFNNAGIGVAAPIEAYTVADWDDVFDVNLRGVAYGIQAVYPQMIAQRSGHIVNTASFAGLVVGGGGGGSYVATKFAIVGLSKVLRVEAAHHDVRVSVVCPGVIRTPLLAGGKYGKMTFEGVSQEWVDRFWESLRPMDPALFARRTIDAVMRNQAVIVYPRWWKLAWYLERLSPGLMLWMATRSCRQMRLELEAQMIPQPARPP